MKKIIILLVASVWIVGCSTAPIYNVENQTVPVTSEQSVAKAIFAGSAKRGWAVNKVQDGLMVATLNHGKLSAEVTIPYTANSYSIYYNHSKHLSYKEKSKRIHARYNRWIKNLQNSINACFE